MRSRPALAATALAGSIFLALNALAATASAAPAKDSTITTAHATPKTSTKGTPVTYTALVSAASGSRAVTGAVTFTIESSTLCTATVLLTPRSTNRAQCTTANTPVGTNTVRATYSGDPTFAGSVDLLSVTVNRPPVTTTTRASVELPQPSKFMTYFATVAAESTSSPTGMVTFTMGAKKLCALRLKPDTSGPAGTSKGECNGNHLPDGKYIVTATYSGDTGFVGSSGTTTFNVQTKTGGTPPPPPPGR
ncbi:MAG: Ig-like domain-containing protein [Pseudonocardiaceae bacterium]